MDKPTDTQKRWFWEQCGLRLEYSNWVMPDGRICLSLDDLPSIDLNSLFKYAVPKMEGVFLHYEDGFYGAEVLQNDTDYGHSGKDPALALFWAIYKALGGKR